MTLYGIHSSSSENCGIAIFNLHLKQSLNDKGISLNSINIISDIQQIENGKKAILHYVPSTFSTEQSSTKLINLLRYRHFENLSVIFHGVYKKGEDRYLKDAICPNQEIHLELLLRKSTKIIALSKTVEINLKSWLSYFKINKEVLLLDHPGLFTPPDIEMGNKPYAFLGGVSRPKKNCNNDSIIKLIQKCNKKGLPIWMHWSNYSNYGCREINSKNIWKLSNGLVSDQSWSNMIFNSRIILCPYETRIQSVSGLIAEAISAESYVLSTGFDYALEIQKRFPAMIIVDNNIEEWPHLIENIIKREKQSRINYCTWNEFADILLGQIIVTTENLSFSKSTI